MTTTMMRTGPALLLFVAFVFACGGKSEEEGMDSSGQTCDDVANGLAWVGDACTTPDAVCYYGDDCGGCTLACEDGVWVNKGCSCADAEAEADETETTDTETTDTSDTETGGVDS